MELTFNDGIFHWIVIPEFNQFSTDELLGCFHSFVCSFCYYKNNNEESSTYIITILFNYILGISSYKWNARSKDIPIQN